jgi:hypothetical protein
MRDNERFEECHVAPGARPEKGHLAPEVKMANEIVCDHVWDKLCRNTGFRSFSKEYC